MMVPALLTSLLFLKDFKINNSLLGGRVLIASLFVSLIILANIFGLEVVYLSFDFSETKFLFTPGYSTFHYTIFSLVVLYLFMFLNDLSSNGQTFVLRLLPFILIGISTEVLIVSLFVSSFFL